MMPSAARFVRTKTPGIYRRGRRYTFPYRTPAGTRRWGTAATLAEAKAKRSALVADVGRGEYHEGSREGFDVYARRWIRTYSGRTSRGIQEQTRVDYEQELEADAIPFFGSKRLSDVRPQDIKDFAAHVASRGVTRNTVRLSLAPVKALFATAFEDGVIRSNPTAGVRVFAPPKEGLEDEVADVKALSEPELAAFLAAVAPEWRLFFEFLAHSGLRIGEAIELRWRDVDLGEGLVDVERAFYRGRIGKPKSRFGRRRLRLTPAMRRSLWALRKSSRAAADEDLVFTAGHGGRIDASNLTRRVLKPAAAAAGVPWAGFHTFRHTCATILFRGGWNPVQVQRWLGHHKASFTIDTYVHLLEDDVPEPTFLDALTAEGVNLTVNLTTREGQRRGGNAEAGSPPMSRKKAV
jgi:integrase